MRLFLASYRFGAHHGRLRTLVGKPGRVAVIANACDAEPASARASALTSELISMRRLGFDPHEFDLRNFVGRPGKVAQVLVDYPFVWVRGGNTFVLRAQLARSGADHALRALLVEDALVYGGYSAGACVLAPTLHGLDIVDDPDEVVSACATDPVWDGLNLIDRRLVVHLNSPIDPDGAAIRLVEHYRLSGTPYWALTDDDVLIADGGEIAPA